MRALFQICLNRTSVGLKLYTRELGDPGRDGPQSNQRGIETRPPSAPQARAEGLNRTSVGLKPREESPGGPEGREASIEPAWD